ncbi:MAG TPA: N-acetylneuraminate synthase family protein [Verrucomicrobiota bacterium]|nr:N-acetylneuraminate synthase family protein [Verrucomicrobiota bacterium]
MPLTIQGRPVGPGEPVYFIADLAANHCGSLAKAKELVHACAESGVDAVKMQNFTAETIVSDYGFRHLEGVRTHQSQWKQSVFDSYKAASIPLDWTLELKSLCDRLGLHYFTSPYSIDLVRAVAPHVAAFKLGSGDITWHEEIVEMCRQGKPVLMATGASTMEEVEGAMAAALEHTDAILLMQCNTEYTARVGEGRDQRLARFRHINLRVLETYQRRWPGIPVGLSDHTHGSLTVLGAVGLFDCCAVEKHFTLDNTLEGQDHAFSMTPATWRRMVDDTAALRKTIARASGPEERLRLTAEAVDDREALSVALGDGVKRLEANEQGTVIVQRRAIRAGRSLSPGDRLTRNDLVVLRPCPPDALPPYRMAELLGRTVREPVAAGDCVRLSSVG